MSEALKHDARLAPGTTTAIGMRAADWLARALLAVRLAALAPVALPAGCSSPAASLTDGGNDGAGGTGGNGVACPGACDSPLVCERVAPAGCADPLWAAWPMPNAPADVAAGAPNAMAYSVGGDGTVTDLVTGLMWQRAVPATMYSFTNALAYCASLTLGGHGGWRLPTEIEVISLTDDSIATPPTINPTMFPDTPLGYYWSSVPMAGSPANAWLVDFNTGSAYSADVETAEYVRCVR